MYIGKHYFQAFFMFIFCCFFVDVAPASGGATEESTDPALEILEPPDVLYSIEVDPPQGQGGSSGGGTTGDGSSDSGTTGGGGKRALPGRDDLRLDGAYPIDGEEMIHDALTKAWGDVLQVGTTYRSVTTIEGERVRHPRGFVRLVDADGELVWSHMIAGSGEARPSLLVVDDFDRIYLAGTFSGEIVIGTRTLRATGSAGFLAALDSSGVPLWANLLGGNGWTDIHSLTRRADGMLFVTGDYRPPGGQPHGHTPFRATYGLEGRLTSAYVGSP